MSLDLHLGVSHRFGTRPACVQASEMGWLPWTQDEVEPPPRTGARAVSPWRRVRQEQEARIAAVEREHREYVESQKKQEQERLDKEQWERDAPKREAEERRRKMEEERQRWMEERGAWLEEQARLKQEAEEQEARKQECRTKIYNTLLEFLEQDDTPRYKVSQVVEEAWYGAHERLERRKYRMCDELFDDLMEDIDTELVTFHDLYHIILTRAQNDAEFNAKMKRQELFRTRGTLYEAHHRHKLGERSGVSW